MRGATPWPALLLAVAGCHGPQRLLAPAGPGASELAWLTWTLLAGVLVPATITLAVLGWALARGLRRRHQTLAEPPAPAEERWILYGTGLVAVVLLGLLTASVRTSVSAHLPPSPPTLTIEVVGHQFWWEVRYPDHAVVTANELHLPAGEPVQLILSSADVIHSFWVPELQGKRDMIPGHFTRLWLQADRPGRYRGQCAEFCGIQHAKMAMWVEAQPRPQFEQWLAEQRRHASEPTEEAARLGRAAFVQGGCPSCHVVRGLHPEGKPGMVGPDLTHLASRRTFAGGTAPLTREALRSFILDPHLLKPGLRMPASALPAAELDALTDWLLSLK